MTHTSWVSIVVTVVRFFSLMVSVVKVVKSGQNAATGRKLLIGGGCGICLSTWIRARQPPVLMAEMAARSPDASPVAPAAL